MVQRLHDVHADLADAVGKDIGRDAFHRMIIAGTGVGYPQIYSHIKTGVVLGLWIQVGGRNGPYRVLPATSPMPPQAQPAAPELAG